MKTILLDENIPRRLKHYLADYSVSTVQENGWGGIKNGKLIILIEDAFNVFITADKNLRYQQNLIGRKISIIEVPFNDSDLLVFIIPQILIAIESSSAGSYQELKSQ